LKPIKGVLPYVAARQEWDATEEKVSSMVAEAAMANQ
jgi:hypothetical protein